MSKVFEKRQKLKEIDSAIRGEYLLTMAHFDVMQFEDKVVLKLVKP